jgi:multidrug efflux pump subunit AcrB
LLTWGLNHKIVIGLIAIAILGGSLTLLTSNTVGTEFLPAADKGELSLFVDLQPGTKLAETDSTVRVIENKLKTIPEINKVFSNTGYQNDGFNEKYSSNLATINVSLIPSTERKKSLSQLSRDLKALSMEVTGCQKPGFAYRPIRCQRSAGTITDNRNQPGQCKYHSIYYP